MLPGRKSAEDLRIHRFGARETDVLLEARERIGRKARALFDRHADLVVPVDVVRRERDQPFFDRLARFEAGSCSGKLFGATGLAEKANLEARETAAGGKC